MNDILTIIALLFIGAFLTVAAIVVFLAFCEMSDD